MVKFGLTQLTAPAQEPLAASSLLADWLRLGSDTQQLAVVQGLIRGARAKAEHHTGRALITQSWKLTRRYWPLDDEDFVLRVPKPPLQTVSGVTFMGMDGIRQTLSTSLYLVDATAQPGTITRTYGMAWPVARPEEAAIQVSFTAGYGADGSAVPQDLIVAMQMMVTDWFEKRMPDGEMSAIVKDMLDAYWCGSIYGDF
jgi:uncharacterized phiE125 gp8 family phage protein